MRIQGNFLRPHWRLLYVVLPSVAKTEVPLKNRMKAKEQYRAWVEGKNTVKQLTVLPRPESPTPAITETDERESALVMQSIRINQLKQKPNVEILARYGWTVHDAYAFAAQLKNQDLA
jgi:hypothetical protein